MYHYNKLVSQIQQIRANIVQATGKNPSLQIYITKDYLAKVVAELPAHGVSSKSEFIDGVPVHIITGFNHPDYEIVQKIKTAVLL